MGFKPRQHRQHRQRRDGSRKPFVFCDEEVAGGTCASLDVRVARLPVGTWATMPVTIVHGSRPGPTVWLSGAVHGDELNGIEIVRRSLARISPSQLSGTVIGVPIVNIFGVTLESRYLPDRRDLNRSFPGSSRGSLASQLAFLFFERVVRRCDFGIDFHTGSSGRSNLPQIRCDLDDRPTRKLARAFGVAIALHSPIRAGSLRAAARKSGSRVLLYEAGEALRFDEACIVAGVRGARRVLRSLGMLPRPKTKPKVKHPFRLSHRSSWTRATRSGFCLAQVSLGETVRKGQTVATIADSSVEPSAEVKAKTAGVVIGLLKTAIVHRGDALVHIAEL